MRYRKRHNLTTWVAVADFFTAFALLSLALYASHRHRTLGTEHWITIDREVKDLARQLNEKLKENGVDVAPPNDDLAIVLPEVMLFASGEFDIVDDSRLAPVANALRQVGSAWKKNFILVIQGHTDAWPVGKYGKAKGYKDNYELSLKRAHEVEKALARNGIHSPEFQVVAQGLGPSYPVADNCINPMPAGITDCGEKENYRPAETLSKNRRIELRFGVFSAAGRKEGGGTPVGLPTVQR